MTMDLVTHFPATDCNHNVTYAAFDRLSKFAYFIPYKYTVSANDLT